MKPNALASLVLCLSMSSAGIGRSAAHGAAWQQAGEDFRVGEVRPQCGWAVDGNVDPGSWKPVAQPELAEKLESAPRLKLTDVAPAPERCWVGHRPYLVPNPDGRSWDMVYPYYNTYGGEQEVVIHDFGTGHTRKQVLSTKTGDSPLTRERIDFHMQPSFYIGGKLVFEMVGRVLFVIYDPAEDAFVRGVKPFGDEVIDGRCVLGEDGMIYGLGWPQDKSGFVAYRFDPRTGRAKRFETFGPANEHRRELYREVRMRGDWLYGAVGSRPWHLVAFNFKTGQGRLLATTEPIIGDYNTIRIEPIEGGFAGHIRSAASVAGIDKVDPEELPFWLHEGEIVARNGDVPPWSDKPAQRVHAPRFDWQREFQVWPTGFEPPSPPPFIEQDSGKPGAGGRVALRYRPGGEKGWQRLEYQVAMYPGKVRLLTEVNDHVLFATDEGYGEHVFYDLATRELRRIGGTISPYSLGLLGGRLYVSGYPGSQIVEYDLSRTLGLNQENPNPKRLGHPASDTHTPLGGTVGGADARVYNAGTTVGRRRIGGGLGWYDTKTRKMGGLPMDEHRIFWMTGAAGARYVVLSSKCSGQGQLFVWDTRTHDFLHRVDPPQGATRPGPVVEALPGLVMGHTVDSQEAPLLYGFDPASGKLLWTKPVPSPPVTAFSRVRRQACAFRRGPDGHVWSFFGDALVRIDPRDARVEAIGRLPDGAGPAQIAFAGGEVYMAGGSQLRRIELVGAREAVGSLGR